MDSEEFEKLRARLVRYGKERLVETEIWKEDVLASDVSPGGTRLEVLVVRQVAGGAPRDQRRDFRADVRDLELRIQRFIREAAQALHAEP